MSPRTRSAAVVGVVVLAALTLWFITEPWRTPSVDEADGALRAGPSAPLASVPRDRERASSEVERVPVEAAPEAPKVEPTTGALIVKVIHEADRQPVADLVVMAGPAGADHRVSLQRRTTDAAGVVRFEELPAGRTWVRNVRNFKLLRTKVTAGVESEAELVLPTGATATGVVVDKDGVPVPGAEIYISAMAQVDRDVEHVGHADAEGRFRLVSCPSPCLIGARADGHAPSRMVYLYLSKGGTKDFRIVLPAPGGSVAGTVRSVDGSPIGGAAVLVGEGRISGVHGGPSGSVPPPALVRTDSLGRFRAVGLPAGRHPIDVRAFGLAPWKGKCEVVANVITSVEIELQAGVTCTGVVVDAAGTPMEKAEVEVGKWNDLSHYRTFTATDGTFRLTGLPVGDVELRAELDDHGKATTKLRGNPGDSVTCRLVLDRGLELRGRVLTTGDKPVERAYLELRAGRPGTPDGWYRFGMSDANGQFVVTNCPEGRTLTVIVRGRGVRPKRIDDVDPRSGPIEIRLEPAPQPSARFVGKVVRPDGTPAAHARVSASGRHGDRSGSRAASDKGEFELGPLRPGVWRVTVSAEGFPRVTTEERTVAADERLDLGTIGLVAGGTVRVDLQAPAGLKPRMSLQDAASNWQGVRSDNETLRAGPVLPGLCHISVFGNGVGSQLVPVQVRSGEESKVAILVEAGHRQTFRFSAPKTLSERRVRIVRAGKLVSDVTYRARLDWVLPIEWQRWLAPGEYDLTVTGDGFSGQARFTVGTGENEVVGVVLK